MSTFKDHAIEAVNKANQALIAVQKAIEAADIVAELSADDDASFNDECASFDSSMKDINKLTEWWKSCK